MQNISHDLTLNTEQRRAVEAPRENSLILAGAGSGKTKTLTTRIIFLLTKLSINPENILAVTFTNKAAKEIEDRIKKNTKIDLSKMWIGTFHGLCYKILRTNYLDAGLIKNWQVMDTSDQASFVKRLLKELALDVKVFPYKEICFWINQNKEKGQRANNISIKTDYDNKLREIYLYYENKCTEMGLVDFNELLLRTNELFRQNQKVLQIYRNKFKDILVDECQDTNSLQYEWIDQLSNSGKNSCVFMVSDDDQCLVENTEIQTVSGLKFISEINKNDNILVLDKNNELISAKVLSVFQNYIKTAIVSITLENGFSIDSTSEHIHLVFSPTTKPETKNHINIVLKGRDSLLEKYGIKLDLDKSKNNQITQINSSQINTDQEKSKNDNSQNNWHALEVFFQPNNSFSEEFVENHFLNLSLEFYKTKIILNDNSYTVFVGFSQFMHDIVSTAYSFASLMDIKPVFLASINNTELLQTPASKIKINDCMLLASGMLSKVKSINEKQYEGWVYDLNIKDHHNFIANNIVTHNSIYGWRGARIENINDYVKNFKDVKVYKLEQNYRSTPHILNSANHLIKKNKSRMLKTLWTENKSEQKIIIYNSRDEIDEAVFAVKNIKSFVGKNNLQYSNCAVLYRSNAQSRIFEEILISNKIPYHITGGLKFFERMEIKDVLSHLRLIYNNEDDFSFERAISTPGIGIGQKTLEMLKVKAKKEKISLFKALSNTLIDSFDSKISIDRKIKLNTKTLEESKDFINYIKEMSSTVLDFVNSESLLEQSSSKSSIGAQKLSIQKLSTQKLKHENSTSTETDNVYSQNKLFNSRNFLSNLFLSVIKKSGLHSFYKKEDEKSDSEKIHNLDELVFVGQRFSTPNYMMEEFYANPLGVFLNYVSLEENIKEDKENSLKLMTLHASKGLEFDFVCLVGWEENIFPSQKSINDKTKLEEERRLAYVGITRAKKALMISHAKKRRIYGTETVNKPSQFLTDLPKDKCFFVDYLHNNMSIFENFEKNNTVSSKQSKLALDSTSSVLRRGSNILHEKHGSGVLINFSENKNRIRVIFSKGLLKWIDVAEIKA